MTRQAQAIQAPDTFANRKGCHDRLAQKLVVKRLKRLGYIPIHNGIETSPLPEILLREDPLNRYKPDLFCLKPNRNIVKTKRIYVEVKSCQARQNFALDFFAWMANCERWNSLFAFVDAYSGQIVACRAKNIEPKLVFVPTKNGYKAKIERINQEYPTVKIQTIPWKSGSGEPFFCVSRYDPILLPLEQLI